MNDRTTKLRSFFAALVCGFADCSDPRIRQAFAAVPREPFAGPGPWAIHTGVGGYLMTPDDDPAYLYQDTLVALDRARGINIGEPSSHAKWLDAVSLQAGESVLQVGVGTGYYTAIIAQLVGRGGRVHAFEIDAGLAAHARDTLREVPQVSVEARSGIAENLPNVDAIYVCAGVTQPSWTWLDALKPGGRLLFPLQPVEGLGGMLLIKRPDDGARWPAKFVSRARFICAEGHQDSTSSRPLVEAFSARWDQVRSFRIDDATDETCWYTGDGWWLSTAAAGG